MPFISKTEEQFLSDSVSAFAADAVGPNGQPTDPNLTSGDPTLALFQGKVAGGDLFLQAQAENNYIFARASTATGPDLDSWMADFSFTRNPAEQASGVVTFSTNLPAAQNILIAPGTIIQTSDGTIQFQVIADLTKAGWSPSLQAYVITAGSTSVDVSVQALVAGAASNVSIGQLNSINTSVPGIVSISNNASITNGEDAESDVAFRQRFILFINSRARGTIMAYVELIESLNLGIQSISLVEFEDHLGNPRDGYVTVVVDDGSGATPYSKIQAIQTQIDTVRAAGIQVFVMAAVGINVSIQYNVKLGPNAIGVQSQTAAAQADVNFVNSLSIGQTLLVDRLIYIGIAADPVNILSVQPSSLQVNDQTADITVTKFQVLRTNVTLVNIGIY